MRPTIQAKLRDANETQIDLRNMDITDQELEEIIPEIKKFRPQLESLYLYKNKISDKGAIFLGRELAAFKKLSFIDLQFNEIDRAGLAAIFALEINNPELKLALCGNHIFSDDDMDAIEREVLNK